MPKTYGYTYTSFDILIAGIASWITIFFPLILLAGHVAADIGLTLVGLLFLVHSLLTRDGQWCRRPWLIAFAVLWLYMIARGLFAEQPAQALKRVLPFIRYAIFAAALAYWTLQHEKTRERFFMVLTVAVVFAAADGLLQLIAGRDIIGRPAIVMTYSMLRLTGPFRQPILGIILTWLFFPACLPLLINAYGAIKQRRELMVGILANLLVIAAIITSGERMACMLLLLGWVLVIFLLPFHKRYIVGGAVVVLLLFAALMAADTKLFERQVLSTIGVLSHWQQSSYGLLFASDMHIAAKYPVFGVGTGHFRIVCPEVYAGIPIDMNVCNTHPHNIYIEWLIENGIIGLGIFLVMLAAVATECRNCWSAMKRDPRFIGLIVGMILHLWPLAPSTSFLSPWGSPPFWLVFGLLISCTAGPQKIPVSDKD